MKYTVGSVFSGGCDGFALAAEAAGMEVIWHIEKLKNRHRYLRQNFGGGKIYDDVKHCGKNRRHGLKEVEILLGGDPCQPHSTAGQRRGFDDDRYLWPEYLRLVNELRPRWLVNENVAGTISNLVLDTKISDLESEGYAVTPFVIPAGAVGAPHQRDRVWIIAHSGKRRSKSCKQQTDTNITRQQQPIQHGAAGKIETLANNDEGRRNTGPTLCAPGADDIWQEERFAPFRLSGSGNEGHIFSNDNEAEREAYRNTSRPGQTFQLGGFTWWQVEPEVERVVHGIPHRVEQIEALGDAVVPQIPFVILMLIKEVDKIYYGAQ